MGAHTADDRFCAPTPGGIVDSYGLLSINNLLLSVQFALISTHLLLLANMYCKKTGNCLS